MDKYEEVAKLLFGDGADELVSKLTDKQRRATTAGLSTVGATAGAAGLGYAAHKTADEYKKAPKTLSRARKLGFAVRNEKFGAALVPLEIAGLGGEVMATKILHNDVKRKKSVVAKAEPTSSDIHIPTMGRLQRKAAKKAYEKGKPVAQAGAIKVYDKAQKQLCKSVEVTWEGEISKMDADKQQVFGWASIVEINGEPVVDLQGDYIDIDEIEKSAYNYVIKSRKGGDMHKRNEDDTPVQSSDMIESFLVTPEKKEKMGLPDSMPTGWWVGYQINDPSAWDLVKSGQRTGFSIHGRGMRTPTEI